MKVMNEMNESNSIEPIARTNLTELRKIRLNKITEIENYFHEKINQRKIYTKKLNTYVTAFDQIGKILIILSARRGGLSIISFTSVGARVGIANASFTFTFSLTTPFIKTLLGTTRTKKKMHHKILMLTKSKLISIETLISPALIDMKIRHEEFVTILKKKGKYENMKENLGSENEKHEIMRLSSIKSMN